MLEVKPNKEVLKIHVSLMGASTWQLVWLFVGMVVGSGIYFILPFPEAAKVPIIIPIVMIIGSIGIVNYNGMNIFQLCREAIHTWKMHKYPLIPRGRKEDYYGEDDK